MMMGRIGTGMVAIAAVLALVLWWASRPLPMRPGDLPAHNADPVAGERVFWAGGCASCHANPVADGRAQGQDRLRLGGGLELETPFGVFPVPNISPHDDGIGGWSMREFASAMQRGVAPDGRHYYPAFPYTSYARMSITDVMDLKAFLDTLEPVAGRVADPSLAFPLSIRRGIGLWKHRYLRSEPVITDTRGDAAILRGRELVEGAGHCGECHTPRDRWGGLRVDQWLGGAPSPEGRGRVPDISPSGDSLSGWSAADIAYYLESGFTPDFDTVGGSMVSVQENMAMLSSSDRKAIAAYLKALPAVE
jgi:mono/diheme cytochrome c family protein